MAVLPTGIGPVTGYNIERSLRFNSADSAYLNRTPASTTNQKTWTFSCWMKRGTLGTNGMSLISAGSSNANGTSFYFSNDQLVINNIVSGGSQGAASTPAVLRDPSAWYHIVLSMDTTQTSFANGWAKIYINGVQQTLTQNAAPTQNSNTFMNLSTNAMWIARDIINSNYFGGYLTEVNFIDGSAKTPIDFGETDASTGVWKPKAYTGTYGTNGFYLPFKTASQWSGYFDGTGDYASFSPTSALNAGTGDFTLEFWTFHLTSSTYQGYYYGGAVGSINFRRTSSNTIELAQDGVASVLITSTTIPANQWVHVAVTRNSGTVRIFINGVSGGSVTYTGNFNSTGGTGTIGSISPASYNLNGYISNLRLITGTALYTANFTPPTAQLTAVSGTQLLTCQSSTFIDNSTNAFTITANGDARPQQFSPFTLDVTDDHSGQGNNWIPNNLDLRTTGAGADILVDSPTSYGTDTGAGGEVRGNYATWNPLDRTAATYTNGNLEVSSTSSAAPYNMTTTIQLPTSGKWYCEVTALKGASNPGIGIGNNRPSDQFAMYRNTGAYITANISGIASSGTPATWTTGNIIGIAYDAGAGTLSFYKDGALQSGGFTSIPATGYCVAVRADSASGDGGTLNAGQRPFAYTAPSGFKALCTQNLPTPTIGATSTTQANDYFDATLYAGNNTAGRNITNSGSFQPDFVWIKNRSGANNHILTDAVRGATKTLISDGNNTEVTATGALTAFNSNGFQVGYDGTAIVNATGNNYVAWNWKANGAGSSNTAGSITSTVSANTTSGFSIVTFTTNNTAGATVGHGCQVGGVATTPDMIIMKYRGLAANWVVYHKSMNATPQNGYLNLNTSAPYVPLIDPWNNTAPSSTAITMGAGTGSAGSTNYGVYTSVAYCFAAVPGYSAFGSYAGNGTTTGDGPFIYTGFKPAFVMLKAYIGSGENWAIYDKSRIGYNSSNYVLFPNLTNVENAATTHIDLLSNGFKLRSGNNNLSSYSYIYAAFAEHPFKYSLAR